MEAAASTAGGSTGDRDRSQEPWVPVPRRSVSTERLPFLSPASVSPSANGDGWTRKGLTLDLPGTKLLTQQREKSQEHRGKSSVPRTASAK